MERYVIGYNIQGYDEIQIDDTGIGNIKNSIVVLVIGEESTGHLYEYYSGVRVLLKSNNRIILIQIGSRSPIRKQLSMLIMSYGGYDIYSVDDRDVLTRDYVMALEEREPTANEVKTFIGPDIASYSEINSILLNITSSVNEQDIEKLKIIIEENRDSIEGFVEIIDYMKKVVDSANSGEKERQIKELNDKVDELSTYLDKAKKDIKDTQKKVDMAVEDKATLQREAMKAKQMVAELENKLGSNEPVLKGYTEVQTQMIKCNVKVIVYFKEISHIPYMASLLTNMCEALKMMRKLKVKLLIYDKKHAFTAIYKPIPIIGSNEYMSNRDGVIHKLEKVVIVEPNRAIIEDILKAEWDVVLIYDRMREVNDVVTGNNVYKYWVLNSRNEYKMLAQQLKIDERHVITLPGILPESISISQLKDYDERTNSSKLAEYVHMVNAGIDNSRVFDLIYERTNIKSLRGR